MGKERRPCLCLKQTSPSDLEPRLRKNKEGTYRRVTGRAVRPINGVTQMQDFIDMTKAELAALIGGMTPSQIKKASHADLVQMAGEKARPTLQEVLDGLTHLEKAVLVAHLDAGMECNGARTLDAMRADNMTWSDVAETAKRTGLTKKQVNGVLASLSTKGLVVTDCEPPNGEGAVQQVLADFGIVAAFELQADGIEAKATVQPKKASNVVKMPKPKGARGLDDRVIQAPGKLDDVRPTKEGSKRALLVIALQRGATIEHLMEVVGWNRETVSSALRTDLKAIGLGCERRNGKYFLMLPEGMKTLPLREATMTRADALVAACK